MSDTITVCSECLTSACWQGLLYCEAAWSSSAGTVEMTRGELLALGREHPSYWRSR